MSEKLKRGATGSMPYRFTVLEIGEKEVLVYWHHLPTRFRHKSDEGVTSVDTNVSYDEVLKDEDVGEIKTKVDTSWVAKDRVIDWLNGLIEA